MNKQAYLFLGIILLFLFLINGCQKADIETESKTQFDLEEFDYFSQSLPRHFQNSSNRWRVSGDDRNDQLAALGRILFYDPLLSKNNFISCSSCHQQSNAFADKNSVSTGLFGKETTRNSMALVNLGFQRNFFWDISGNDLRTDVMKPVQNHIEMGIQDLSSLPEKLQRTPYYKDLFQQVFDTATITEGHISRSLTAFMAALYTYQSKYDKEIENSFKNFTRTEQSGMDLFLGKAKCGLCHEPPHFVPSWGFARNIGLDEVYEDEGNGDGRFKVPTLRNIEFTAPYMHDGRFETLEEVIDHYDHGVQTHKSLSWELKPHGEPIQLNLTTHEKEELIAFLKTLSDPSFISDERFSNPF